MTRRILLSLACLAIACGDDDTSPIDGGASDSEPPFFDAGESDAGRDAGPPPAPSQPATAPFVQWVDPLIGTGGLGFGVGSVSPAPQTPFGFARPAPDTTQPDGAPGFNHCAGYYHPDTLIDGFSQVRAHGMGIAEYGFVALMPTDGMTAAKTNDVGYRRGFSHDDETSAVGYYSVTLDDGIRAELTASDHVAFHRYTFPSEADATVIVDLGHHLGDVEIQEADVHVDAEAREVWGSVLGGGGYARRRGGVRVYFVARFDRDFAAHGVFADGTLAEGENERTGSTAGAWVRFEGDAAEVAVGLSFTDLEGARANLDAQLAPFDEVRAATEARWEALLSRVRVSARGDEELRVFYSSLYRSLLMPTLAMDVDGRYRGLDHEVHQIPLVEGTPSFRYSTDHSLWDTYRTQIPLLSWLYPELQRDMVLSLLQMATDGGYLPRWPLGTNYTGGMVGDGAALQLADAAIKGVEGVDWDEALRLARITADAPTPVGAVFGGRAGIEPFMERGWVGIEEASSSASWTLEVAYADYAMARLAEHVGEDTLAAGYDARAGNWRNLWDPASEFLVGRHADGRFAPTSENMWEDYYAEGNSWQYLFFVPHDLEGLATQMGGNEVFLQRLERFFTESTRDTSVLFPNRWYWHGNEPDIHAPFAFAAVGAPEGTWRWSRWVARTYYDATPNGLPGNDDAGTLSAWYVFAALGVYPITAMDRYVVAAPLVTHADVDLPGGGTLVIDAPESSDRAWRVDAVRWNDAPYPSTWIDHASLAEGGTLTFDMVE
ncbi:MAG: glycoside hydrolase family 92 protein [Sandaracinus sp.]|nr:glycoside hydrolase family 92 protein [Sandaracinus sp.]